jgi:hypothetical protein
LAADIPSVGTLTLIVRHRAISQFDISSINPNEVRPFPNSRMGNDGISDYTGEDRHRDNPNSGELRMTAEIIQFRDYQIPRYLAPMHGDVETSLAELNRMAAEVFNALMIDTAPEYSVPTEDPA